VISDLAADPPSICGSGRSTVTVTVTDDLTAPEKLDVGAEFTLNGVSVLITLTHEGGGVFTGAFEVPQSEADTTITVTARASDGKSASDATTTVSYTAQCPIG
jgi:hypothetical protein